MSDTTEEERPVHTEFNMSTGEVTHTPISDQEWADMKKREADAIEAQKKIEADNQALRESVAQHDDPVVKKLAERLGII